MKNLTHLWETIKPILIIGLIVYTSFFVDNFEDKAICYLQIILITTLSTHINTINIKNE